MAGGCGKSDIKFCLSFDVGSFGVCDKQASSSAKKEKPKGRFFQKKI